MVFYRGGILSTALKIAKNEGLRALWKGWTPTVLRNGSNQMANFFVYDNKPRQISNYFSVFKV